MLCRLGPLVERLDRVEYLLCMALYLNLAPLMSKLASLVDHECAALDAHEFSAVQRFLMDHVELGAQLLIWVGQQIKREFLFRFEFLV